MTFSSVSSDLLINAPSDRRSSWDVACSEPARSISDRRDMRTAPDAPGTRRGALSVRGAEKAADEGESGEDESRDSIVCRDAEGASQLASSAEE